MGGELSGPGITGNSFDPGVAGSGTHEIKYVFDSIYYEIDQTGTFNPISSPGHELSLGDDNVSDALPIGFTFTFFDLDFTEFYISSNGFITFNSNGDDGCCEGQLLPNSSSPNNLIAVAWTDLIAGSNRIKYFTLGKEPNRICVIDFSGVSYYSGEGSITAQIKLFESSNTIEIHSTDIQSSDDNDKTMGIENVDGTLAYAVEGRNASYWKATNDFVKFTPVYCTDSTIQEVIVDDTPAQIDMSENLNYGEVFLNDIITKNIQLTNPGCNILQIDSLKNTESVFSFTNTPFNIMPGETRNLEVSFSPTTIQTYIDTIQIFTNDVDTFVTLNGEGITAPIMTVDTDTLRGAINNCSGTLDFTFNIENTGQNNLEYEINPVILTEDFEDNDISDWNITENISASITQNEPGNGSYSLKIVGSTNRDDDRVFKSFQNSTPDYVKFLVKPDFNSTQSSAFLIGPENSSERNASIIFIHEEGPGGHYFSIGRTNYQINELKWYLIEFKNINFISKTFDFYIDGKLIEQNITLLNPTNSFGEVSLTNVEQSQTFWDDIFIGYNNSWQDINPLNGNLSSGNSDEVSVTFNSDDLFSGIFVSNLIIKSNDPQNNIDTVVCILTVDGEPEIEVSSTSLNYEDVLLNDSTDLALIVYNNGCDTLFVDSLINSKEEFYLLNNSQFEIMPDDSTIINIYFKPSGISSFSDDLILYHSSSEELTINLTGNGTEPPVMTIDADTIEVTVNCSETASASFNINNNGNGILEYNISELNLKLQNLNANYSSILNAIPNRIDFDYDGDDYYISDGYNDMYDDGNYLSTNLGGDLIYSDNEIIKSIYLGADGKYFVRKYDGLFVFAGSLDNISTFYVKGELGADGDGEVDGDIITLSFNGTTYYGLVKRVFDGDGDPSVNHLFITKNPEVQQEFNTNTDDDYHKIYNLENTEDFYYLLYASDDGGYINNVGTTNIMEKFLNAIRTENISVTPMSGTITSSNSELIDIEIANDQIAKGEYFTSFIITSNDPLNPLDTVTLKLTVDGQADISLPTECINFGKVAVNDTLDKVLTIENIGCDTLFINDIDASVQQYFLIDTVFEILPHLSVNVPVYFNPDAGSTINANLDLETNIGAYQVCLNGEGVATAADISTDSTSIAVSLECQPYIVVPVKIFNSGEADLNYTISADESFIELSQESGIVLNNESTLINVNIIGSILAPGNYMANIKIISNDPDSPSIIIPVTLKNISGGASLVEIDPQTSDICLGDVITLNAGFGFADYNWSTGESTFTIDVNESDDYIITVTDFNGCESSDTATVTAHNPVVDLGTDATITTNESITLDAGSNFESYLWNDNSELRTLTVNGATTGEGNFEYSVTITDIYGCTDSDAIIITVETQTGINSFEEKNLIKIYPVPARDFLNLEFFNDSKEEIIVELYDISGKLMYNNKFENILNNDKRQIDLTNYKNGTYLLKIFNNKVNITEKIIIQK